MKLHPRSSPSKHVICVLFLLNLLAPSSFALKCYVCSCYWDCIVNNHVNRERECPSDNACLTMKGPGRFIAKFCWTNDKGNADEPGEQEGQMWYWCYYDLCNKGDYHDGKSESNPKFGAAHAISPWTVTSLILTAGGIAAAGDAIYYLRWF